MVLVEFIFKNKNILFKCILLMKGEVNDMVMVTNTRDEFDGLFDAWKEYKLKYVLFGEYPTTKSRYKILKCVNKIVKDGYKIALAIGDLNYKVKITDNYENILKDYRLRKSIKSMGSYSYHTEFTIKYCKKNNIDLYGINYGDSESNVDEDKAFLSLLETDKKDSEDKSFIGLAIRETLALTDDDT